MSPVSLKAFLYVTPSPLKVSLLYQKALKTFCDQSLGPETHFLTLLFIRLYVRTPRVTLLCVVVKRRGWEPLECFRCSSSFYWVKSRLVPLSILDVWVLCAFLTVFVDTGGGFGSPLRVVVVGGRPVLIVLSVALRTTHPRLTSFTVVFVWGTSSSPRILRYTRAFEVFCSSSFLFLSLPFHCIHQVPSNLRRLLSHSPYLYSYLYSFHWLYFTFLIQFFPSPSFTVYVYFGSS